MARQWAKVVGVLLPLHTQGQRRSTLPGHAGEVAPRAVLSSLLCGGPCSQAPFTGCSSAGG